MSSKIKTNKKKDYPKNEGAPKSGEDLKNEDNPKNEDAPKIKENLMINSPPKMRTSQK